MGEDDIGERILRLPEVIRKTGLGSSTIYRRIAAGTFPKPKELGTNSVGWKLSDVDRWIAALPSGSID